MAERTEPESIGFRYRSICTGTDTRAKCLESAPIPISVQPYLKCCCMLENYKHSLLETPELKHSVGCPLFISGHIFRGAGQGSTCFFCHVVDQDNAPTFSISHRALAREWRSTLSGLHKTQSGKLLFESQYFVDFYKEMQKNKSIFVFLLCDHNSFFYTYTVPSLKQK